MSDYNKQTQFIKVIYLRKLVRTKESSQLGLMFSKMPLLLTKYEVLPNLCFAQIDNYLFMDEFKKANYIKNYDLRKSKIGQSKNIEIQHSQKLGWKFFILQLKGNKFAISRNQISFYLNYKLVEEFNLMHQYEQNKTTYDKQNKLIYIINQYKQDRKESYECEVFNLVKKQTKSIAPCKVSPVGFGCSYALDKVYSIGGFNNDTATMSRDI